jgi:glycosyltransferase involved in cell wall biosynthesis
LEKWSIRFADAVLTPNVAFRDLFVSRGCPLWKIHIVMNSPQETIFKLDSGVSRKDRENGFVIMYHGHITAHNGLDVALEAIARLREQIPILKFEVYGDGDFTEKFLDRVNELNLNSIVNIMVRSLLNILPTP